MKNLILRKEKNMQNDWLAYKDYLWDLTLQKMSRNFQTIKALRENFLKRNQVDKDFFTLPAQQEHSLTDEALFSPSDYLQPILHHQRQTQTVMRGSSIPLYLRNKGASSDF